MLTTLLFAIAAVQANEAPTLTCPGGTALITTKYSSGHIAESYCGKKEKNGKITKMGPYIKFGEKGLRTHDAEYWNDKPIYRVLSSYDKHGRLVRRQIQQGDAMATVQVLWDDVTQAVTKIRSDDYKAIKAFEERINAPKYVPIKLLPRANEAKVVDPSGRPVND